MKIVAILCTFNRHASLAKTLESLALSVVPETARWEVLVVDNNSTDETRLVAEDFVRRHPEHFRYLFEARQGKSFALNSALRAVDSDVLAFVDDDVIVERDWLHKLVAPLSDKKWSGAGGRILPEIGFKSPQWLERSEDDTLAPLAMFDKGQESCELFTAPFGTNMAFRKEMFTKYGGFRTDLGPQPGSE